jgi:hypothetical protein
MGQGSRYMLDGRGVGVRVPVVQTVTWPHPPSYPMGTGNISQGVKRREREVAHSPGTNADVKNMWICTSIPHTSAWRGA